MKKLFLTLIVAVVGTMSSFSQDDLVATLTHGSNHSYFVGADGLSAAYEAAANGDVITLSPGVFNAITIEKAITVRGAGMIPMESNGNVSTQISGTFTINVPSSTSAILTIEGIHALGAVNVNGNNLAPVKVLKSRFERTVEGYGVSMNAFSCIFVQSLEAKYFNSGYENTTLNCMNCVINGATSQGYEGNFVAKIVATNCVVNLNCSSVPYSVFTNCVISSDDAWSADYPLPETCEATNCVGINSYITPDLFKNIVNSTNTMIEGSSETAYSAVFQTLKTMSSLPITEDYKLTTTAAATYLGDDGTQVGIYGGPNPFDITPVNPQIKKFTVSSTTESGKLKVRIDVK